MGAGGSGTGVPDPGVRGAVRALAVLAVLSGWLVLLRGLFFLTPSTRPEHDLEAGPAFGVNVEVYLPAVALSVVVLWLLALGATARRSGPPALVVASLLGGGFGCWVLTREQLLDYLPGLEGLLRGGIVLCALGLFLGACAGVLAPRPTATQQPTRRHNMWSQKSG